MNVVVSCFLWLFFIYLQEGDAASCTSGFPSRLIYDVSLRAGSYIRLIPEMSFACNGVITGYTVALRQQNGDQDPVIQTWRKNTSQLGSYYKISPGIAIDSALCVDGLTRLVAEVSGGREVLHCNLNQSTRVSVQAGDILGLARDNDDIKLAFARVSSGPTNYVFDTSESQLSYYALWRRNQVVRELPQITLEIGSDSNCIRGFPDVPVSEVGSRTTVTNMTTLLIPEMNFTCNASVVGFIVSGRNLSDGPHSQAQIWRKISQSSGSYYQVGSVSIHDGVCVAIQRIVGDTHYCILPDNFRVSVQPGDILGLELPATDNDEILFTNRGPTNYIFRHLNQLDSNTNLSLNGNLATAQQLPQIIFNLTSAHCLSGFPEAITRQEVLDDRTQVFTRLFPELKFGCFGTIVRFTAAVWDTDSGLQNPKIQIWREDKTRPGLYHKISSNVQIQRSNPPCIHRIFDDSTEIFQCTLREDFRISVQPGDFLGLEIPSRDGSTGDDLIIYFKAGGPTNLIFQGQLESTVDLFTDPHTISNHEPQITFLVVLDEGANSCPDTTQDSITSSSSFSSTTTMPDAPTTKSSLTTSTHISTENASTATTPDTPKTSTSTTQDTRVAVPLSVSNGIISVVVGGIIGGVIAILLLVVVVLLTMTLIQLRKRRNTINRFSDQNAIYDASPNPAYGVSSRSTVQTDHHDVDDISLNPAYGVSRQDMPQDGHDEAPDYMII